MRRLVASAWITSTMLAGVSGQNVLDRVLARVGTEPITLTDARAAIGLGLVEASEGVDPVLLAMRQLIERRLVLAEVDRFTPPEPGAAALAAEVAAIKQRVGTAADLARLERATGVGEAQIRDVARDNLRIQAYLNQRFGANVVPSEDEVGQYYRTHLDEFRRNGQVIPFVEAEPMAREKAGAERRRALIFQWTRELRQRGDVVELYPK